jgi:hypothetical protein
MNLRFFYPLSTLFFVFGLAAGCSSTDEASSGGADPDAGAVEEPPPACPEPTEGPTTHAGDIEADEVWTAAGSPHLVTGDVSVRAGARLTIEPCAEVLFDAGAHLLIAFPGTPTAGSLVAEGNAERPIRFAGHDGARWASLQVHAPGTARLAYVTLEGGGGGDFEEGATLSAYGDGEDGADPLVFVDHVAIAGSLGTGAWLQRGAAFAPGSADLTIRDSGSEDAPWPIEIEEHAIDTLPTGSYTGNRRDEILLDPAGGQVAGEGLLDDATLHDRGVPYHVGRDGGERLAIGGRTDGRLVTLTIEAGVVMRFAPGSGLNVQTHTNNEPATAALRVLGTAEKPVVFTSASDTPAAGDWRGLWFGGVPDASDRIDHARIEYAGGECGCILSTCSAITAHEGAVILTAQPAGPFITHTEIRDIAGHGVTEGFDGSLVDFRPTNTFAGVAGCAQTRPRNPDTTCPDPLPACDE